MAKKPKKEAVDPAEEQGRLAAAEGAVTRAAEKVVEVARQAVEAVREHVVAPVVKAVRAAKPKKKRFVRGAKAKQPQAKPASLLPRSTKATAKLMTKGLAAPPKEDPVSGQKPKA